MSQKIHLDAELSPALHSLRRMTHPNVAKSYGKATFELYDPSKPGEINAEKIGMSSLAGTAPGSPGSIQDYNQIVMKLQQELELSKRKEAELIQMIRALKDPMAPMDKSYISESPSDESIVENVKDAHIRHLQRQVTVLQASLYKSEGWANRVADTVKERDNALEHVAVLTAKMNEMQKINTELLNRIDSLSSVLQATHANLQQATEELQSQHYSGKLMSQLKEEITRQGNEIKTLKETHNRLDIENKGLKDSNMDLSGHHHSNVICSQELEHLHKVVDRLKNTVLQQRSYLLQLKHSNNAKLPSSATYTMSDSYGVRDQESSGQKNSSSPSPKHKTFSASPKIQGGQQYQGIPDHQKQTAMLKSRSPNLNDESQQVFRPNSINLSQVQFPYTDGFETLHEAANISPMDAQRLNIEKEYNYLQHMANKFGYTHPLSSRSAQFSQQISGDKAKQKSYSIQPTSGLLTSETNSGDIYSQQNRYGIKLDVYGRQIRPNMSSANNSSAQQVEEASDHNTNLKPPPNDSTYMPVVSSQQETRIYETNTVPSEPLEHFVLNGNLQPRQSQSGNPHFSSSISKTEPQYKPPLSYLNGSSIYTVNNDFMAGGKLTVSTSPAQSSYIQGAGKGQSALNDNGAYPISNPADQNPSRTRQDSNKQCPVCNHDFNYLSLEDFQTHILECFDEDSSPVTMKPIESSYRSCPMCNEKFSPTVAQADYERHVHEHFEEVPDRDFVILQP